MSMLADDAPRTSRLTAADPNLAFLASRAAIQLDRILQGRSHETDAVEKLASLLRNSAKSVGEVGEPASLWDPTTISLIHSAVTAEGTHVGSLDELIKQAARIAHSLETSADPSDNTTNLERLRAFCVGLANSAVANERSQIESFYEKSQWS